MADMHTVNMLIKLSTEDFNIFVKERINEIETLQYGWYKNSTDLYYVSIGYVGHKNRAEDYKELLSKFAQSLQMLEEKNEIYRQYDGDSFKFFLA